MNLSGGVDVNTSTDLEASIDCKTKQKISKELRNKLSSRQKRFSALSLMTAGNKEVSGFSNMTHEDYDFLPAKFDSQCERVIKKYFCGICVSISKEKGLGVKEAVCNELLYFIWFLEIAYVA